ncbi:MAG: hypothetical protein GYA12_12450 [Chloroflexi bacterium]|nr:hypothetical protein [Chloroflexota bacterium]
MRLKSIPLGILIFFILFGGIAFTSAMNWWQTESSKIPARYTEGEAAGQYNPADIRGSYTFGDINKNFGIPLTDLQAAFRLPAGGDVSTIKVNSLETLYEGLTIEMGTGAVRLFTAFYLGLPYDLASNEETFLFPEAAAVLKTNGKMTADQAEFLSTHTLKDEQPSSDTAAPAVEATRSPTPAAASTEHVAPAGTITGKTTFQQLLDMGLSAADIQSAIGEPVPDPAMAVKDYATAKGLEFSTLKTALQSKLDAK